MNKDFMEFMRAHYNHVAQQDFKMTVVRAPTPSSTPSPAARPVHAGPVRAWPVRARRLRDSHVVGRNRASA